MAVETTPLHRSNSTGYRSIQHYRDPSFVKHEAKRNPIQVMLDAGAITENRTDSTPF